MLVKRAIRFAASGVLATAIAYVVMMLSLLQVMNYVPATVLAWTVSLAAGFLVNRRFTFGIVGPYKRIHDFGRFFIGALLQLAIGLAAYSVTLGWLHLDPTIAFLIVLVLNTSFSFAFLNLVVFHRRSPPPTSAFDALSEPGASPKTVGQP